MSLFLERPKMDFSRSDKGMEKVAFNRLDDDPKKWEENIITLLHEQFPFMSDIPMEIKFKRTDPSSGSGLGQVNVGEEAVIPLIIKEGKLQPLDLFWYHGKLRPMTSTSLLEALQPVNGGKAIEIPSMLSLQDFDARNMTDVPQTGKYVFASVAEKDDVVDAASIMTPDELAFALVDNPIFARVVREYNRPKETDKTAEIVPVERITGEVLPTAVSRKIDSGCCLVTSGIYKHAAFIPKHTIDLNGNVIDKKVALFFDKTASAVQDEVYGFEIPSSNYRSDAVEGYGSFVLDMPNLSVATLPVKVLHTSHDGYEKTAKVTDMIGTIKTVHMAPEIKDYYADGDDIYLSTDWKFWRSGGPTKLAAKDADNDLVPAHITIYHQSSQIWSPDIPGLEHPTSIEKTAAILANRYDRNLLIEIIKTAAERDVVQVREDKPKTDLTDWALDIFRSSGLKPINLWKEATAVRLPKQAEVTYPGGYAVSGSDCIKVGMFKYAETVTAPVMSRTLDTMLGLNFLTEENIGKFLLNRDIIDEARDVCAALLLAARLGLDLEQAPLRTAMFALERVSQGLEQLKATYQQGMEDWQDRSLPE